MRIKPQFLTIICLFAINTLATPANAADQPAGASQNLARLEVKFFQRKYLNESDEARLARIEKLVLGEEQTGSVGDRLSKLVSTVPDLDSVELEPRKPASENNPNLPVQSAQPPQSDNGGSREEKQPPNLAREIPDEPEQSIQYPAVTAIEKKILGRDYSNEPIKQRLDRLEAHQFGKPTTNINDLSERVDRLKQTTGIDVTRENGVSSAWSEEDDDSQPARQNTRPKQSYVPPSTRSYSPSGGGGGGYYGFGGGYTRQPAPTPIPTKGHNVPFRNVDRDPNQPVSRAPAAVPESSPRSDTDSDSDSTFTTDRPHAVQPTGPASTAMGLATQVALIEREIYGKSSSGPIKPRLDRLEQTVFPREQLWNDRSITERMSRLSQAVPTSSEQTRVSNKSKLDDLDKEFDDDFFKDDKQLAKSKGKMNQLINNMSNMMNNMNGFTGGYSMPANSLVKDPKTGLLLDRTTGNLIDPQSGAVVGRQAGGPAQGGSMNVPSFNNGMAPYGGGMMPGGGSLPGIGRSGNGN